MPAAKPKAKTIAKKASAALDESKKALGVAAEVVSDLVTAVQKADTAFKKARKARVGVKKSSSKKTAKKSTAKKSAAKKPAAKKSVAKKSVAKKSVAKRSVAKKSAAKKPVAKRAKKKA